MSNGSQRCCKAAAAACLAGAANFSARGKPVLLDLRPAKPELSNDPGHVRARNGRLQRAFKETSCASFLSKSAALFGPALTHGAGVRSTQALCRGLCTTHGCRISGAGSWLAQRRETQSRYIVFLTRRDGGRPGRQPRGPPRLRTIHGRALTRFYAARR